MYHILPGKSKSSMLIRIHVTTDAKEELIQKVDDNRYDIAVREPAEDNRANQRVLEIMETLHPSQYARIISGYHASAKIISLEKKS